MIRSKIASLAKAGSKTMTFLWGLLVLALHLLPGGVGPAQAQGTRKDDIVFNSRGIPLAGATVRVCAMPATGQPCTPLALIYADSALTQALANPTITDGLGNYFFYAAPGKYQIEISGPGITTRQIPDVSLSGVGVQTTTTNTFTATQNFDADIQIKGPNPYFSLSRYGGYSSTSATPPSTTGTIAASGTILTLTAAQDFANGQGIVVYQAGALPTLTTPAQPTVTPTNWTGGATTYTYRLIAEDRAGGLTAAGTAGSTATGAATLGANNISLTTCSRTGGVATYTSSAAHNLQAGAQVSINGFGGTGPCNGVKTIAATPTSTTFTTNDGSAANETVSTGTVTVMACNVLTFPNNSLSGANMLRYWVYRNGVLAGVAVGLDPWFQDCGTNVTSVPSYIPTAPPASAQPGYLVTTIVSGGGTTSLTLANSAATAATTQTVLHDNSPNLKAAFFAAVNAGGGQVYIPSAQYWVFNSLLDLSPLTTNGYSVRVHLNSPNVYLNQPWIPHSGMEFEGEAHYGTSFLYLNGSQISGSAHPFFYIPEFPTGIVGSLIGIHFSRLVMNCTAVQQTCVWSDEGPDGGGPVGLIFEDFAPIGSNNNSRPLVLKGGYDHFFNRGICQSVGTTWNGSVCVQFTNSSFAVTNGASGQVPGRVKFSGVYIANEGFGFDCQPNTYNVLSADIEFTDTLYESGVQPYVRFSCPNGFFSFISIRDLVVADTLTTSGTPVLDGQNANVQPVVWIGGYTAGTAQYAPALITGSGGGIAGHNIPWNNLGNVNYINFPAGAVTGATNGTFQVSGANGRVAYPMASAAAPLSAVAGAGGNVPVGTRTYGVVAVDADGLETMQGPKASVAVTTGNQTVTVTPPALPTGAIGWRPYRDDARATLFPCTGYLAPGAQYVDTTSYTCGQSIPGSSLAAQALLNSAGLSATQLRLVNQFSATVVPAALSANRSFNLPDWSGTLLTFGYQQSAYDNFNRANGALGSSWTSFLPSSSFVAPTITGNQIVGNTATKQNYAFWNANNFLADQFTQFTATSSSTGGNDSLVATLRMSASGGYACSANGASSGGIYTVNSSGTFTSLAAATVAYAAGDVLRCEAKGTTITLYKNGVSQISATDSTFASGAPGFGVYNNGSGAQLDNWSGGNLRPSGQLDTEQDWNQPQHFTNGLIAGASTNPSLARYGRYTATLSPAQVAANTCAAQSFTVTGLLAADVLIGISKPTEQAGLSAVPGHVTGANTATINFCNVTAAPITPTASESYNFVVVQ